MDCGTDTHGAPGALVAAVVVAIGAIRTAPVAAQTDPDVEVARPVANDIARGTHAAASFQVGAVGTDGFGAGFGGLLGWSLSDLWSIQTAFGLGGRQGRGGGAVGGVYTHVEVLFPVTFNVCASIPRVCPGLDLEVSLLSGGGYAYLDGDHSGNLALGVAVSSLRKTQDMDVGVRTAVLTYLDIVGAAVERSADRVLGMVTLQLGFVIRWGFTQP